MGNFVDHFFKHCFIFVQLLDLLCVKICFHLTFVGIDVI
jgi:hypothetical protein